jgi:cobalt/nickel transport protein
VNSVQCSLILGVALCASAACAHVQVLVPVQDAGDAQSGGVCELDLRFVEHASRNGPALPMGQPREFGVVVNQKRTNLTELLKPNQAGGQPAFTAKYTMREAGAHVFFLQPSPYWEPAEQVMVTHYTKVIINSVGAKLPTASGMGWENWEGWDTLVGLPVEIEPTVQCTSLWTGSAFTGIVRVKGKPAPHCRVEIEYLNDQGAVKLLDNSYLTHILKTNAKGEFTFVPVHAGWWALTAIPETKETARRPDGKKVKAELGGVLWIRCVDMDKAPTAARWPSPVGLHGASHPVYKSLAVPCVDQYCSVRTS